MHEFGNSYQKDAILHKILHIEGGVPQVTTSIEVTFVFKYYSTFFCFMLA